MNDERAKISVSLPDDLKQQLDDYAAAHQLTNSEVVQKALRLLFQPESPQPTPTQGPHPTQPPPPAPGGPQPPYDLNTLRGYVTQMAMHQEHMRQGMAASMMPCPPMLPPPPWFYGVREPDSPWPANEKGDSTSP